MHRRVLAEVALEADGADARVGGVQALHDRPGRVARAVVHEHELVVGVAERRRRPAVQLLERRRLVQERDDDREARGERGRFGRAPRRGHVCLRHLRPEKLQKVRETRLKRGLGGARPPSPVSCL